MLDPPEAATIGLFRLINRYLAEPTPSKEVSDRHSKPCAPSAPASPKTAIRTETKHARIVAMLRSSAGATIAAITVATGWQQHSVRGFLPGGPQEAWT